jgi:molybdate-binding protein
MFERVILNCQKNYSLEAMTTTDENWFASEEDTDSTCVCQEKQQSMGLKYIPLRMQEYDMHLHLKFMLESNHKGHIVFQTAPMMW